MPEGLFLVAEVTPEVADKRTILDPRNDVIVEACAGSGKTWLLTSRIIRALLSGAKPSEILAITFTRKAAREMKARLTDWLRTLALSDDKKIREFLLERGVSGDDIDASVPRARRLYREYLSTSGGLNINTFHGWFIQVLRMAPWSAQSGRGRSLSDNDDLLLRDVWEDFFQQIGSNQDVFDSLNYLYSRYELHNTHEILKRFLNARLDWWASSESDDISKLIVAWRRDQDRDPLGYFLMDQDFLSKLVTYKALLRMNNLASEMRALDAMESIEINENPDRWFLSLRKICKEKKISKAMTNRMGADKAEQYVRLSAELQSMTDKLGMERADWLARQMDRAVKIVGDELLKKFQSFKTDTNVLDFSDLEWNVRSLLLDDDQADFVLHRLDSRYTHLLVDEFQDTNPIQWTILKSWIGASHQAGTTIKLFFVGDPKQSIYRFRRAEPRLFEVAEELIVSEMGGLKVVQNFSYRNAAGITNLVNECFRKRISNFVLQQSVDPSLPSEVEVMPLIESAEPIVASDASIWRDPLVTRRSEPTDDRHYREGLLIAEKIHNLVSRKSINVDSECSPIKYSDILILIRRRTHLKNYEDALRSLDIPFVSQRNGALLESPEVQDVIALLSFLFAPHVDHHLINVLKSPIFSIDDGLLKVFINREEKSIWTLLVEDQESKEQKLPAELCSAAASLSIWINYVDKLPVHDLLDMVYSESDLINRYAGYALPDIAERVRSNLIAFLEYSLDFSGGRFPSIERFLEQIRVLQFEEGAGPGEGSQPGSLNSVRIMTIHGAKGLEAPVVFLADATASPDADNWNILVDWTPGDDVPNHFSIYGARKDAGQVRTEVFQRHDLLNNVEDINLLYVAVTRAKQAFFVSGVASKKQEASSWYFQLKDAVAACERTNGLEDSSSIQCNPEDGVAIGTDKHFQEIKKEHFSIGTRVVQFKNSSMDFGTLVHKILEIGTLDVGSISKGEMEQMFEPVPDDFEMAWETSLRIINAPPMKRFFDSLEYVKAQNEVAYVNRSGDMRRIDRLVEFDEEIWIVDYKISLDHHSKPSSEMRRQYKSQLVQYRDDLVNIGVGKPIRIGVVLSGGELIEL